MLWGVPGRLHGPEKGWLRGHEIAFALYSRSALCSGLLLAFYRLLLVRKVSFRACRRYLVAAVFLSAVIPALDIPLYPARTVVYPLPLIAAPPAENFVQTTGELPAAGPVVPAGWRRILRPVAVGGYLTAVFLSLGFLAVRMVGIRRLRRRSRLTDCGAYTLAEHPQIATPFRSCARFSGRGIRRAPAHDRSLP